MESDLWCTTRHTILSSSRNMGQWLRLVLTQQSLQELWLNIALYCIVLYCIVLYCIGPSSSSLSSSSTTTLILLLYYLISLHLYTQYVKVAVYSFWYDCVSVSVCEVCRCWKQQSCVVCHHIIGTIYTYGRVFHSWLCRLFMQCCTNGFLMCIWFHFRVR